MNPAVVEVEAERLGSAVAEGEGCGGFGGVGEPVQLGEPERAVGVGDVAEHAAGADRGELLVITDQPDTAAASDDELHGGVKGKGVGHPGFVNHHQGRRPDRGRPVGQVVVAEDQVSLARVSVRMSIWSRKDSGGGRRRREPDHSAAVFGPGGGEGPHRGGFAGAGGGDRQLQPCPRGAHLADQRGLPGVQGDPVRRHLAATPDRPPLVDIAPS